MRLGVDRSGREIAELKLVAGHDVLLSRPEVRERAYHEVDTWMRAYVEERQS